MSTSIPIEVYTIYGVSFFVLAAVALVPPRHVDRLPIAAHLPWLGAFGMLHGTLVFVDLWALQREAPVPWSAALLVASGIAILEFARRAARDDARARCRPWVARYSGWIYLPLVAAGGLAAGASGDIALIRVSARFLALGPGSIGAAWYLSRSFWRADATVYGRRLAGLLGGALAAYGLLAGYLADPAQDLPTWLLTHAHVADATGIPVQAPRALAMLLSALALGLLFAWLRGAAEVTLERRLAEESARLAKERNMAQHLLDASPAIILVLSSEGRIEMVNPAFETITGYRLDEVRGRDWLSTFIPEREQSRIRQVFQEARGGKPTRGIVNPILTRDGREVLVEWHNQVLRNDHNDHEAVRGLVAIGIDVTARVEAEAQARRTTAALRLKEAAIATATNGIAISDAGGIVTYVNSAFVRLWRLSSEAEAIGRSVTSFWRDPSLAEQVVTALQIHGSWSGLLDAHRADDQTATFSVAAHLVRNETGGVDAMMASFSDISDQQRAAWALQESELRLRTIVELDPSCVKLVGQDGALLDINPAGLKMLGADDIAQLRLRNVLDLIGSPYIDQYREGIDTVFRGERTEQVYEIVALDGSSRWVGQVAVPMPDPVEPGRVTAMLAVTRDITARRAVEEQFTRSEARLRQAQQIAGIGNWELDLTTRHLWWSDEIFRLFSLDQSQFSPSYEAFLAAIHPDDREAVHTAYTRSLETREPYCTTHRLQHPNGSISYVEERCETDFAPDGAPLRSRGTVQDVTTRVETEQALRTALADREVLLREVHHRVKNNLQVVSSLLYFHSKRVTHADDLHTFAQLADRLRAMTLVHEHLYHSPNLESVDVLAYLRGLTGALHMALPSTGPVTVEADTHPLRVPVNVAMALGMIVSELLSNANKHAFPDGRAGQVTIRLSANTETLQLVVADNGTGLPENLPAQASGSFGWRLVQALVNQLRGAVAIRSTAPGTCVTVTLPRTPAVRAWAGIEMDEEGTRQA